MPSLIPIRRSVGTRQPNEHDDVKVVQELLNRQSNFTHIKLIVDGAFGPQTERAITAFQRIVLVMKHPDGIVSVTGPTLQKLMGLSVTTMVAPPKSQSLAAGQSPVSVLTDSDYAAAARTLGCEVAAIKAVADTESSICGIFDSQNRPVILYERHYFHNLTKGIWDKTHPGISNAAPFVHYGKCSIQYTRLQEAEKLDSKAALMSASWGAFQIMGANWKEAGFASVDDMVSKMGISVQWHLSAFVNFILSKPGALAGLQNKKWADFAYAYNGSGYKKNNYDTKMAAAYAKYSAK